MKIIIVKFWRVSRYGVAVLLAAVSCFSASANCVVTWTDGPPAGWFVDCGSGTFVPAEGGGGGGSGGSCTNCTAMTPSDCEAMKSSLNASVTSLSSSLSLCYDELDNLENVRDSLSASIVSADDDLSWIDTNFEDGWHIDSARSYLQDAQSTISFFDSSLKSLRSDLSSVYGNLSSLSSFVGGIDCSPCSVSGGGSSGGGDSGGGGGGGTTPSGCPCSEFINAVKTAVDNCKTKLDDIDTKLGSIKARLDSWDEIIKQIKNDVHQIRQTTDRMDDFFRDDTEVNFKKLIEHVLVLSNAVFSATVKLPPNLYWTEYTNATQFLDDSGSSINWLQKGKTIEAGADGAVIDFGEYSTLNWFQRMEFLLGHVAGIFSPTNSTNADFSSQEKEKAEDAQDVFDGLTFDGEKSILNQMVSYVEQAEGSLNPFHGLFHYSSGSTRSITFLPDVSVENELLGNTMPTITMDLTESGDGSFSISDLVDLAHNLTTFLWLVSFFVIDVLAIIKFVQCLIAINRWYWKIYNSWVGTMFNGAGR